MPKFERSFYSYLQNINSYITATTLDVSDRDSYKAKADEADELADELNGAYSSIGSMAQGLYLKLKCVQKPYIIT